MDKETEYFICSWIELNHLSNAPYDKKCDSKLAALAIKFVIDGEYPICKVNEYEIKAFSKLYDFAPETVKDKLDDLLRYFKLQVYTDPDKKDVKATAQSVIDDVFNTAAHV